MKEMRADQITLNHQNICSVFNTLSVNKDTKHNNVLMQFGYPFFFKCNFNRHTRTGWKTLRLVNNIFLHPYTISLFGESLLVNIKHSIL